MFIYYYLVTTFLKVTGEEISTNQVPNLISGAFESKV